MIQTKEKKCKGTGKASGHGCGELSYRRKNGLCMDGNRCYQSFLLNSDAGKEILSKNTIQATKKVTNERKKEVVQKKKEFKEKNKSIAALILEARKPFQQWIRMRDANCGCASCGQIDSEIWDGGHFKKAELYTGLIFDERNCNKQCRKCNTYLNGNEGEYRKRLIGKHGPGWVLQLDEDADDLRQYSFSREELVEIKNKYLQKIKDFRNN